MSKQLKITIIILVLAIVAYLLFVRKPWVTFNKELSDFAITDTASITKIFLVDVKNNQITLEKTADGNWTVNQQNNADLAKINLLLQTIHDVQMRNPLGDAEHNTVVKELAAIGIKVEFYNSDDKIKTIYVGQITADQTGTYMMIDGSTAPYVTHIPGFVGYLTPRFETNPVKWLSKLVFNSSANQIKTVQVSYPQNKEYSFTLDNSNAANLVLTDANNNIVPVDVNFCKYYLASFNSLYCEAYDDNFTAQQHDSINKLPAFCTITLATNDNKTTSLKLHYKNIDKRTKQRFDESGNPLPFDSEQYFGFANGSSHLMYIQHYNFGKLIRSIHELAVKK